MGTAPQDFVHAMKEKNCIVGLPEEYGGAEIRRFYLIRASYMGLKQPIHFYLDRALGKQTYAIQGLGKVGFKVAERLLKEGANIFICDHDEHAIEALMKRSEEIGQGTIKVVSENDIYI